MVTWTFDLLALIVGFLIGMCMGSLLYCTLEMRDGGSYAKGLYDGCNLKDTLPPLKPQKEEKNDADK